MNVNQCQPLHRNAFIIANHGHHHALQRGLSR
jgi:hypothetical protein